MTKLFIITTISAIILPVLEYLLKWGGGGVTMNLLELTDKELKMLSYELHVLIKTDIQFSAHFLLLVRKNKKNY